jgi:hypothetical protein
VGTLEIHIHAVYCRGQKDFICREEKRKTAYWRMQRDPETGDSVGQGGEWGFIAFFPLPEGRDAFQMQMDIP